MRMHRVMTLIVGLVVMVGAIAAGALTASAGTGPVAAHRAAARADAAALLARLKLPAGARSSVTEPSGAGAALVTAAQRPVTPNLVDKHGFWVVPGRPAAVLAFIARHAPAGAKLVATESGSADHGLLVDSYGWPARAHVLSTRQIVVAVVSVGRSTALRADALDVWMTPRPASERIPRKVDKLEVTVVNGRRTAQVPLIFTASRQIGHVRALIDGLPAAQPGASSCPADFAIRVRLAFYAAGGTRPLAVARVDPDGCQDVQLAIGSEPQPPLTSEPFPGSGRAHAPSLVTQLDRTLGVTLPVTGP
jgi:hypothetical protein